MVRGLDGFREHFAEFVDRFVIIGGTACDLLMAEVGQPFRATKDIDIVLCLEAFDAEFAAAFWRFISGGRYSTRETDGRDRRFHRFRKPGSAGYPFMLELFSRVPDLLGPSIQGHLTPIPVSDPVSSLSAILMDGDSYAWAHAGRTLVAGLPVVRAEHLIPLKAMAWLDLDSRKAQGGRVDSRDLRKHKNDVFRLYAIADPEYRSPPPASIRAAVDRFIEQVRGGEVDLPRLGLDGLSLESVISGIRKRYGGG